MSNRTPAQTALMVLGWLVLTAGVVCLIVGFVRFASADPSDDVTGPMLLFGGGGLGMVVGPSPEMAGFVREHHLGRVATSFDGADFTAAIAALTPEEVAAAKQSAHEQARSLSSDADVAVSEGIVRRLLGA